MCNQVSDPDDNITVRDLEKLRGSIGRWLMDFGLAMGAPSESVASAFCLFREIDWYLERMIEDKAVYRLE